MNTYAFSSIRNLKEALKKGFISRKELLQLTYDRFSTYDAKLGAALEIFDEDSVIPQNTTGLLAGIPGLVKDNIAQKGRLLTCASRMLEGYRATYNATVVDRIQAAGALVVGRSNMDEFAMGSSTETSAYQKTCNPWDLTRVPGGSSGGSAAAVAAGLVPWALGSDTGGSARQPAAFCGIVAIKPTYGLVSRFGLVALASSLDQIGPFTRTVYDNALVLSSIAGHDAHDSTTHKGDAVDYAGSLTGALPEGFTLGVIENALQDPGMDPEVGALLNETLKEFERLGAHIKRIAIPVIDTAAAVYFMINRAEAASNLARFDGIRYGYRTSDAPTLLDMYQKSRDEGMGFEVKSRILAGNYVLSSGKSKDFYKSAQLVQGYMRHELLKAFKEVDMLFLPTTGGPAFPFGAYSDNVIQMNLQDYFTAPANITGHPALSIPCGFTRAGLPVGFQLMGPDFSEAALYQVAYAYEQATPWHTIHPSLYCEGQVV
ncbi:Asp-tRNA(Asn)/Glu-tRNA(Gln) amidotransferase subunit GatA [Candidatus Dependentiae bacterium]|nr:Asp-tRNA(Asn)/Glu-tRNA(Gln) amidotransferase subunit GatA [Candidatus Dependentiae bacterium]